MEPQWTSFFKELVIALVMTVVTFLVGLCVGVPVARSLGRMNINYNVHPDDIKPSLSYAFSPVLFFLPAGALWVDDGCSLLSYVSGNCIAVYEGGTMHGGGCAVQTGPRVATRVQQQHTK